MKKNLKKKFKKLYIEKKFKKKLKKFKKNIKTNPKLYMATEDLKKIFDESIGGTKAYFISKVQQKYPRLDKKDIEGMVQVPRGGTDKQYSKGG